MGKEFSSLVCKSWVYSKGWLCDWGWVPLPSESWCPPLLKWWWLAAVEQALDCFPLMGDSWRGHLPTLAPASPPVSWNNWGGSFFQSFQLLAYMGIWRPNEIIYMKKFYKCLSVQNNNNENGSSGFFGVWISPAYAKHIMYYSPLPWNTCLLEYILHNPWQNSDSSYGNKTHKEDLSRLSSSLLLTGSYFSDKETKVQGSLVAIVKNMS